MADYFIRENTMVNGKGHFISVERENSSVDLEFDEVEYQNRKLSFALYADGNLVANYESDKNILIYVTTFQGWEVSVPKRFAEKLERLFYQEYGEGVTPDIR